MSRIKQYLKSINKTPDDLAREVMRMGILSTHKIGAQIGMPLDFTIQHYFDLFESTGWLVFYDGQDWGIIGKEKKQLRGFSQSATAYEPRRASLHCAGLGVS
jgi:hypothetical protein